MKFKSQVYTQVSGSIGGITYSHNQGGLYTRARSIPVNPGSTFQVAVRALVSSLTNYWVNTLTPAQRAAWDLYAANVLLPDPFGDPRLVSGLNMFSRTNVPLLQAAGTQVNVAPGGFDLGSFTPPTIAAPNAAADTVDVSFNNADPWATAVGGHMLIYLSRPQNPSINFFKGPYRFAGKVSGAVVPPTSPATITLPFPCVVGQRVFVKISFVQVDGRLSLPFRSFGTAV